MCFELAVHHSLPVNVHSRGHISMTHHLLLDTHGSPDRIKPTAESVPEGVPAKPWNADPRGQRLEMTTEENACMVRLARHYAREHPALFRIRCNLPPSLKKGHEVTTERNDIS